MSWFYYLDIKEARTLGVYVKAKILKFIFLSDYLEYMMISKTDFRIE
jgi:hypothetical protein